MMSQLLDPMDQIPIIGFFTHVRWPENKGVWEGAVTWLIPFFMKKTSAAIHKVRLFLKERLLCGSVKGLLTSYVKVVNLLLEAYKTDYINAETEKELYASLN